MREVAAGGRAKQGSPRAAPCGPEGDAQRPKPEEGLPRGPGSAPQEPRPARLRGGGCSRHCSRAGASTALRGERGLVALEREPTASSRVVLARGDWQPPSLPLAGQITAAVAGTPARLGAARRPAGVRAPRVQAARRKALLGGLAAVSGAAGNASCRVSRVPRTARRAGAADGESASHRAQASDSPRGGACCVMRTGRGGSRPRARGRLRGRRAGAAAGLAQPAHRGRGRIHRAP